MSGPQGWRRTSIGKPYTDRLLKKDIRLLNQIRFPNIKRAPYQLAEDLLQRARGFLDLELFLTGERTVERSSDVWGALSTLGERFPLNGRGVGLGTCHWYC